MTNVRTDSDTFDKFFGTLLLPRRQIVIVRPHTNLVHINLTYPISQVPA